jgi:hypothetical protein
MDEKNIIEIAEDRIISDLCLAFWDLKNKILISPGDDELKKQIKIVKDKIDELYKMINEKK